MLMRVTISPLSLLLPSLVQSQSDKCMSADVCHYQTGVISDFKKSLLSNFVCCIPQLLEGITAREEAAPSVNTV